MSTPLDVIVGAFEELAKLLNCEGNRELRLDTFCDACSLVSVLFSCLGLAFKFAEMEYVAKVHLSFLLFIFSIHCLMETIASICFFHIIAELFCFLEISTPKLNKRCSPFNHFTCNMIFEIPPDPKSYSL